MHKYKNIEYYFGKIEILFNSVQFHIVSPFFPSLTLSKLFCAYSVAQSVWLEHNQFSISTTWTLSFIHLTTEKRANMKLSFLFRLFRPKIENCTHLSYCYSFKFSNSKVWLSIFHSIPELLLIALLSFNPTLLKSFVFNFMCRKGASDNIFRFLHKVKFWDVFFFFLFVCLLSNCLLPYSFNQLSTILWLM